MGSAQHRRSFCGRGREIQQTFDSTNDDRRGLFLHSRWMDSPPLDAPASTTTSRTNLVERLRRSPRQHPGARGRRPSASGAGRDDRCSGLGRAGMEESDTTPFEASLLRAFAYVAPTVSTRDGRSQTRFRGTSVTPPTVPQGRFASQLKRQKSNRRRSARQLIASPTARPGRSIRCAAARMID